MSNASRVRQLTRQYGRQALDRLWRFLKLCRQQFRRSPLLFKRGEVYYIPLWLPIALALLLASTVIWGDIAQVVGRMSSTAVEWMNRRVTGDMADFFSPPVHYWSAKIDEWADNHGVDRDLLATVMQIESCGHPTVVSGAGARGLFQVMPFHFAEDEDMLDPDTNARRGASFLKYCHETADEVIGLTLACYNGGPSVINQPRENWSHETQKYYRWGVGIYSDAAAGRSSSATLDLWLEAGGGRLCNSALGELQRSDPATTSSSS